MRKTQIQPESILEAAEMLKCIGHPVRLQILELLDERGEQNVTAIYETLGLEQSVTSQHLTLMRDKDIVKNRREGVNVFYRIGDERVIRVLDCIRHCEI